jgi:hypothetical protein
MIDPHATSHHVINSAALMAPVVSWLMQAQPILTAVLTLLGIGWYVMLYFKEWRNRNRK